MVWYLGLDLLTNLGKCPPVACSLIAEGGQYQQSQNFRYVLGVRYLGAALEIVRPIRCRIQEARTVEPLLLW